LAVKVLSKTMDTTTPTADKLEFSTVTRNEAGEVVYRVFTKEEIEAILIKAEPFLKEARDAEGDM
jgi:20S proteasome subunit alpha 3